MAELVPPVSVFLAKAEAYLGTPYIWAGKGAHGIDCSGLVTAAYRDAGGPDWRGFHNAQKLFDTLPLAPVAKRGVLCFFGEDDKHVIHVGILTGKGDETLEASGGGHDCTTEVEARRRHACVKYVTTYHRKNFLGLRALPLLYL